jgi:hypothetical protein
MKRKRHVASPFLLRAIDAPKDGSVLISFRAHPYIRDKLDELVLVLEESTGRRVLVGDLLQEALATYLQTKYEALGLDKRDSSS